MRGVSVWLQYLLLTSRRRPRGSLKRERSFFLLFLFLFITTSAVFQCFSKVFFRLIK